MADLPTSSSSAAVPSHLLVPLVPLPRLLSLAPRVPRVRKAAQSRHEGAEDEDEEEEEDGVGPVTSKFILPLELLQKVLSYLPRRHLATVNLVARSFYRAALPLLWRHIDLVLWRASVYGNWLYLNERGVHLLALLEDRPHLGSFVRSIKIELEERDWFGRDELLSYMDALGDRHLWDDKRDEFVNDCAWEEELEARYADEDVTWMAIFAPFGNVRELVIANAKEHLVGNLGMVVEIVSSLPLLTHLHLRVDELPPSTSADFLSLLEPPPKKPTERPFHRSEAFPSLKTLVLGTRATPLRSPPTSAATTDLLHLLSGPPGIASFDQRGRSDMMDATLLSAVITLWDEQRAAFLTIAAASAAFALLLWTLCSSYSSFLPNPSNPFSAVYKGSGERYVLPYRRIVAEGYYGVGTGSALWLFPPPVDSKLLHFLEVYFPTVGWVQVQYVSMRDTMGVMDKGFGAEKMVHFRLIEEDTTRWVKDELTEA
ncbi:hypothetical protein JCM6882_002950 [Rhodosporidiobolus microsporus]